MGCATVMGFGPAAGAHAPWEVILRRRRPVPPVVENVEFEEVLVLMLHLYPKMDGFRESTMQRGQHGGFLDNPMGLSYGLQVGGKKESNQVLGDKIKLGVDRFYPEPYYARDNV